jgi:hypothetical protein
MTTNVAQFETLSFGTSLAHRNQRLRYRGPGNDVLRPSRCIAPKKVAIADEFRALVVTAGKLGQERRTWYLVQTGEEPRQDREDCQPGEEGRLRPTGCSLIHKPHLFGIRAAAAPRL